MHAGRFGRRYRGDEVRLKCSIPASAIDLSFVASLTARVALDVLEENVSEANHWLWSRDPAPDVDARFAGPYTTVCGSLPRHRKCPACHEPDVSGIVLPESVWETIVAEVETSLSVETGGILLGYVNTDRKAIVVRATGPGRNAKRAATNFERSVEFVQAEIERAADEFGCRGLYLGEWHSHLESDPEPSDRDIMSLCGIAQAHNYATRCPVMIIAGLDKKTGKVTTLKGWCFPVSGRVFSAKVQVVAEHGQ